MRTFLSPLKSTLSAFAALLVLALVAMPASAPAAPSPKPHSQAKAPGSLVQLSGARGCLVDRSTPQRKCGAVRALKGPGPFMGSRAIAISPDGKNVYVASSRSNAVAVFMRSSRTGVLTQPSGTAGCVATKGAGGCGKAVGLNGPNSVAVSANGRNVYVTSRSSNAITAFSRNRSTGALRQLPGDAGCISGLPLPGCATGRALVAPDVVVASADGKNVYAGSFLGNAVAVFTRDPSTGGLTQPSGTTGCIAEATSGCATAVALGAPEGMAISADGSSVYVAAALSNAVVVLARNASTGALTQPIDGSGCIVNAPLTGCTTGVQLSGANAIALGPGDYDAYVTSLSSDSVTAFSRSTSTGGLTQLSATAGCLVYLRSAGCSFGRALSAPEGLAVSSDGANVYAAAFASGAIDILVRNKKTGKVIQKAGSAGCISARSLPGCSPGRALRGVSSIALSADGRFVYSTSFGSNAVDVFRRVTASKPSGSR